MGKVRRVPATRSDQASAGPEAEPAADLAAAARPAPGAADLRSGAPAPVDGGPGRAPGVGLRLEAVGIAAVVVVGVAARFVTTSPLWLDEALSVNIARLPIGDIPEALRHDGHPPLYYVVLHFWMRLFGSGDVAVRLLSALFGLAALVLLGLAARRAAGTRAAWAAVLIGAVTPFAVRYSTEARMYSLVMALVAGGYLAVRRAIDRPRLGRLTLVALVSGALLLTHYWALWFVAATAVVLAGQALRTRRRTPATAASLLKVTAAVVGGGVLLLPWLPSLLYQAANTGTPWADPVRPTVIVQVGLQEFGSGASLRAAVEGALLGTVLAMLFVVGLFGRTVDDRRLELDVRTVPGLRAEAMVIGATIALAAAAGFLTGTTFASRYLAAVFPLFVIVAAAGLAKLPGRPARLVVAAGLVALALVGVGVNALLPRTQAGEVADAVRSAAVAGDVVVFCPDQLGPAYSRELPSGLTELAYPALTPPARVDWVDYVRRYDEARPAAVAEEVVDRAGATGAVWVVTAGGYDVSDRCASFVAALGGLRGAPGLLVAENPDIFEPASLLRFGAG